MAMEQASYRTSDAASSSTPPREAGSRSRDGDGARQYYIAVDRVQYKMGTLLELLTVLGRRDGMPLVICCSTRDGLDAVAAALIRSGRFLVSMLHSDSDESERATTLETFRLAMSEWNHFNLERLSVDKAEMELRPGKSQVLVVTDVCLPSHSLGETPLLVRIMINYDIPSKKEIFSRRMAACLGSPLIAPSGTSPTSNTRSNAGKMSIMMVVGDEVVALRNLEESSGIVIDDLPINIFELV